MKLLRSKKIAISLVGIIFAIVVAIVVHALLPASVDVNDFDSLLVVSLGFPFTACLYFFLVYSQIAVVTGYMLDNNCCDFRNDNPF